MTRLPTRVNIIPDVAERMVNLTKHMIPPGPPHASSSIFIVHLEFRLQLKFTASRYRSLYVNNANSISMNGETHAFP